MDKRHVSIRGRRPERKRTKPHRVEKDPEIEHARTMSSYRAWVDARNKRLKKYNS